LVDDPKISSWWGRFCIWTREAVNKEEVSSRVAKVEHAIEVVALRQPMSVENVKQAKAISSLTAALDKVANAVILSGAVVMVKWTDEDGCSNIFAKTLSVAEVRAFEDNQHLLTNPQAALAHLHLLARASRAEVLGRYS
jgi:hypothetical protein